jgi:hypothetical protein
MIDKVRRSCREIVQRCNKQITSVMEQVNRLHGRSVALYTVHELIITHQLEIKLTQLWCLVCRRTLWTYVVSVVLPILEKNSFSGRCSARFRAVNEVSPDTKFRPSKVTTHQTWEGTTCWTNVKWYNRSLVRYMWNASIGHFWTTKNVNFSGMYRPICNCWFENLEISLIRDNQLENNQTINNNEAAQ